MPFAPAGSHLLSGVGAGSVQLWPLLLSTVSSTSFSQVFCELSQFPDVRGMWSREGGLHRTFHPPGPPRTLYCCSPASLGCRYVPTLGSSREVPATFRCQRLQAGICVTEMSSQQGEGDAPKSSSSLLRKPFIVLILLLLF